MDATVMAAPCKEVGLYAALLSAMRNWKHWYAQTGKEGRWRRQTTKGWRTNLGKGFKLCMTGGICGK